MKAVHALPNDYKEIFSVDLQKDKKLALLVNGVSLLILAVFALPMHFVVPITTLFDLQNGVSAYMVRAAVMIVSMLAYILLHEAVHGVAMKLCGTKKIKYGFTGLYAFAGSEDYYDKKSYCIIALAPIVLWGVLLAVVNVLVPIEWFWVVYFVQLTNLSGAAGDLYVSVKFSKLPADILIRDSGVGMTVYSKQ